ncbi:hypothetical protein [Kocuria sp. KH4]
MNDAAHALLTQPLTPERLAADLGIPVEDVQGSLEWLEDQGWVTPYAAAVAPDGSTVATSWQLQVPSQVRQEMARRDRAQPGGNRAARRARRKGWGR